MRAGLGFGRLDEAPVPFSPVATDLRTRDAVVVSSGDVVDAFGQQPGRPLLGIAQVPTAWSIFCLARRASWRQVAAGLFTVWPMVSKGTWKMSWRTRTTRSDGVRRSSTTSIANRTLSSRVTRSTGSVKVGVVPR